MEHKELMIEFKRCAGCACAAVTRNPATARLLGLCPLLAVSDTVFKAVALGLLFALVVIACGTLASLFRYCVSWRLKPMYHALIASFVTALVIAGFSIVDYAAIAALGIYPALLASNCFVLSFMQEIAERKSGLMTLKRAASDTVSVLVFLIAFAAIRELAAYGVLFTGIQADAVATGPLAIAASAPGALLTFALVLAAINAWRSEARGLRTDTPALPNNAVARQA
jgi:electron transport complex protein RnfE